MADYPSELKYSKDHEWARTEGNEVTIGISAFAVESLGDVVFVDLPEVGTEVKAGEPFGAVESTKAMSELFSPVTGKVTAVNGDLADAPESVNEEPYGKGWMIRVELTNPAELDAMLDSKGYADFVAEQG